MNGATLKNRLPRTWGAFFGRYGNFTPAQIAAIPSILAGEQVVVCAPTASGKTEAALAPLIERYLPSVRPAAQLTLIYLLPTRALINDLRGRLATPFENLRLTLAVKTRDLNTFTPQHPTDVLLTTPESLDSLLAAHPHVLRTVRAVIIDELHIFDSTVRGNQLRVVLRRIQQIRAYAFKQGEISDATLHCVALSATLAHPQEVAQRYFHVGQVINIVDKRTIAVECLPIDPENPTALLAYLNTFQQRGWRKALVFCNTRAEVEAVATALRAGHSPFGESVFVHYSNLERERRYEIEQQFAHAETAICCSSSTLELGIDIGDIDVTLLIGAPGNAESFVQRAGRSNRRGQTTRIACFYRTPLEHAMFEALPQTAMRSGTDFFSPSVAVQQLFSLLKQSPHAALRLNPLYSLFEGLLSPDDLQMILGELQARGYLKPSRMGEWRAGERLNRLIDQQASEQVPLSLFSNIQTETGQMKIRDYHSQQVLASVDRQWLQRDTLTLEGRSLQVSWYDGEALWVSAPPNFQQTTPLHYLSARQALSYELAQQLAQQIGLQAHQVPVIKSSGDDEGWWCFHWLGDHYGRVLLDLLRYTVAAEDTAQPGVCLWLQEQPQALPHFSIEQVNRHLSDHYRRYEQWLSLGAYHRLLPTELRRRAVVEQFNVSQFIRSVSRLHLDYTVEALAGILESYVR